MSTTTLTTLIRLRAIQNKTRELFECMNDTTYRLQFHPDLSALGWHLGHGMFIENYWLHEVIQGNKRLTENSGALYIPENCPKAERGPKLPKLKELLSGISKQQDINDLLLLEMSPPLSDHELFKDEYIQNFIIQHYAQHYETMRSIFNQIAILNDKKTYQPNEILSSRQLIKKFNAIDSGTFNIGGEAPLSYDNELPTHSIELKSFNISQHPVSNAEYLLFMEQQGYEDAEYWCDDGWQWRQDNKIYKPEHWSKNNNGEWYGIKHQGPFDLIANQPVYGINHYEALAFAKWAKARLPHEYEWETSVRLNKLPNTGQVWEWCSNTFKAYDNFKAFPYDEYSTPWFDGNHYVMRGASQHTRPEIRRASFRNFFNADKRHFFSGLRLIFD